MLTPFYVLCHHCSNNIEVTTKSAEDPGAVTWCDDCIHNDRQLLIVAGASGHIPNHGPFTWLNPDNVEVIKGIAKRYSVPTAPPTLKNVVDEVTLDSSMMYDAIHQYNDVCWKSYTGTGKCSCGGCKDTRTVVYNRDAFGYKRQG